jgi:hypothetical protein
MYWLGAYAGVASVAAVAAINQLAQNAVVQAAVAGAPVAVALWKG